MRASASSSKKILIGLFLPADAYGGLGWSGQRQCSLSTIMLSCGHPLLWALAASQAPWFPGKLPLVHSHFREERSYLLCKWLTLVQSPAPRMIRQAPQGSLLSTAKCGQIPPPQNKILSFLFLKLKPSPSTRLLRDIALATVT